MRTMISILLFAWATTAFAGEWRTSVQTDPMDDFSVVIAQTRSDEPYETRFGQERHATLGVYCRLPIPGIVLVMDNRIGRDVNQVRVRFDDAPPEPVRINVHENGRQGELQRQDMLLAGFRNHERVLLEIVSRGHRMITEFSLDGANDALDEAFADCGEP